MEYKSLYAYLGHGAGSKLGKEVATKASELGLRLEKVTVDKKTLLFRICLCLPCRLLK